MLNAVDIHDEVTDLCKKSAREGYLSKDEFNRWAPSVESMLLSFYCDQSKQLAEVTESLRPFLKEVPIPVSNGIVTLPTDYRRFEDLWLTKAVNSPNCGEAPVEESHPCDYCDIDEWADMKRSPIRKPDWNKCKVRYRIINGNIEVSENSGIAKLIYIRNPIYGKIAFTVNATTNEEEVNLTATKNFEWLEKDRNKLIDIYLMKLGLSIRDPALLQWIQTEKLGR
jgi:hypothetical protein